MKNVFFTTHPIQYQVPIFQELVRQGLDVQVYYASDHSIQGNYDKGFSRPIKWDIPMLEGYKYRFLKNSGRGAGSNSFFSYVCPEVRKILKQSRPDAVIIPGYNRYYYLQVVYWCRWMKIPLFLRGNNMDGTGPLRTGVKQRIRKILLSTLYQKFSGFFSIGSYMTAHYKAHGVSSDRIYLTPYCNNSILFRSMAAEYSGRKAELRAELGIPKEAFVVICSGRFISWKRFDIVIDAVENLENTRPVHLILLGDGPERECLLAQAKERLTGQFLAPGFINQSELGRYYAAADIFVLASEQYHETWGLVVNEAMEFGLPVIVSDGVGCRNDLVSEGDTGYVFRAGDTEELSARIEMVMQNPALLEEMRVNVLSVIRCHSVEENATRIMQALNAVVSRPS